MIVIYQFEFAICPRPLNTVLKEGPAALMELFARGQPDEDGTMPELDPSLIRNVEPVKITEQTATVLQREMVNAYPRRQEVARNIWRDYGGQLPESVDVLEWFKPETGYSRNYDFHLRSGGTLESWLAGETAGALLDLEKDRPDGKESNA